MQQTSGVWSYSTAYSILVPVVELEPLLRPGASSLASVTRLAVPAGNVVPGGELGRLRSLPAAVLEILVETKFAHARNRGVKFRPVPIRCSARTYNYMNPEKEKQVLPQGCFVPAQHSSVRHVGQAKKDARAETENKKRIVSAHFKNKYNGCVLLRAERSTHTSLT